LPPRTPNIQKVAEQLGPDYLGRLVPPRRKEKNKLQTGKISLLGAPRISRRHGFGFDGDEAWRAAFHGHGIVEASLRRVNRAALTPVEARLSSKVSTF